MNNQLNYKRLEQFLTLYILYTITYFILVIILILTAMPITMNVIQIGAEDLGSLMVILLAISAVSIIITPIICWKLFVLKYKVVDESDYLKVKKVLIWSPILFPIIGNSIILILPAGLALIVLKYYSKKQNTSNPISVQKPLNQ